MATFIETKTGNVTITIEKSVTRTVPVGQGSPRTTVKYSVQTQDASNVGVRSITDDIFSSLTTAEQKLVTDLIAIAEDKAKTIADISKI